MKNKTLILVVISIILYVVSIILFVSGQSRTVAVIFFIIASVILCVLGRNKIVGNKEEKK